MNIVFSGASADERNDNIHRISQCAYYNKSGVLLLSAHGGIVDGKCAHRRCHIIEAGRFSYTAGSGALTVCCRRFVFWPAFGTACIFERETIAESGSRAVNDTLSKMALANPIKPKWFHKQASD